MNLPSSRNYNTYQVKNQILGTDLSFNKQQWIDSVKESFTSNLDYRVVTKNSDSFTMYDMLIYRSSNRENVNSNNFLEGLRFLSYPYDIVKFDLGDYLNFKLEDDTDSAWIIEEINKLQLYDVNGRIERCNNTLSFQLANGDIVTYPCILDSNNGSLQYNDKGLLITINSDAILKIQYNQNTVLLTEGQRLIIDNRNGVLTPDTYRIMDINTKNVYSGQSGYMILYLEKNAFNPKIDNLSLNICNYFEPVVSIGTAQITYSDEPIIKVGGNYKTFTAIFEDSTGNELALPPLWSLTSSVSGGEIYFDKVIDDDTKTIKIKALDADEILDSVLTLTLSESTNTYTASLSIEVIGL